MPGAPAAERAQPVAFGPGPLLNLEGDEGVLVPEPGRATHGAAHQEDPRQHRRGRPRQDID